MEACDYGFERREVNTFVNVFLPFELKPEKLPRVSQLINDGSNGMSSEHSRRIEFNSLLRSICDLTRNVSLKKSQNKLFA